MKEKFERKVSELEKFGKIVTSKVLKKEYTLLKELIVLTEKEYSKNFTLLNLEKIDAHKTKSTDSKSVNKINIEDFEEPSEAEKQIIKNNHELERLFKKRIDDQNKNMKMLTIANNKIKKNTKYLLNNTMDNLLDKDFSDIKKQVIYGIIAETALSISTLGGINLNHLKTLIDISNIEVDKVKTADEVLTNIEFQQISFSYVLEVLKKDNLRMESYS